MFPIHNTVQGPSVPQRHPQATPGPKEVPNLKPKIGSQKVSSAEEIGGNLNLLVIAHCIAKSLPAPNEAQSLFSVAFHIPPSFLKFTNRKNNKYGIHIVRGGTLRELKEQGAVFEVCDLG